MHPRVWLQRAAQHRVIVISCVALLVVFVLVAYRSWNTVDGDFEDQTPLAQVGDIAITKGQLNEDVATTRVVLGLESRSAWEAWLSNHGVSEEEYRELRLESLVRATRARWGAEQLAVDVTESEVDAEITLRKAEYLSQVMDTYMDPETEEGDLEAAWDDGLAAMGYTETTYREAVRTELLEKRVREVLREQGEDPDSWLESL